MNDKGKTRTKPADNGQASESNRVLSHGAGDEGKLSGRMEFPERMVQLGEMPYPCPLGLYETTKLIRKGDK